MDEQEAITKAQALLNRPGDANVSPLAVYRHAAKADSVQQRRPNVVLIMMESMSAKFMKHFGQSETLTPFLIACIPVLSVSAISIRQESIRTMVCMPPYILFRL